jgi:hypothetical protein
VIELLDMGTNSFSGPLPASWGSFKALATLDLSNNQLLGGIPFFWGTLGVTRLSQLSLFNNFRLVGCLPRGLERFAGTTAVCQGTSLTCSVC